MACPYDTFEFILVDDGSYDNTSSIVSELIKGHSCFKYFFKPNGGVSSARNFGIRQSRGQYIAFVDSDDTLSPAFFSACEYLCSGCNVRSCCVWL